MELIFFMMVILGIFSEANQPYLIGAGIAFIIGLIASIEEVGKFFTLLFNIAVTFFLISGIYFLIAKTSFWWDFSPFLMAVAIIFGGGIGMYIAKVGLG